MLGTDPKFPTTATRQRSSNVNINNAEIEFTKTALSACRSTISQQEMELRRLKETLEIRNKRITQLEAQVTHASGLISSRNTPTDISEDKLAAIVVKIENLATSVEKLHSLSSHPSNHIVVNSCHTSPVPPTAHGSTQTGPVSASSDQFTENDQSLSMASTAPS